MAEAGNALAEQNTELVTCARPSRPEIRFFANLPLLAGIVTRSSIAPGAVARDPSPRSSRPRARPRVVIES
eukprot:31497-Pelagococcus_subviridis.AAC.36